MKKQVKNMLLAAGAVVVAKKMGLFGDDDTPVNGNKKSTYDLGMARMGNGLTIYNRAKEEKGEYKNIAHIDSKGKIKFYDKKLPSKIKKQIEDEAKKM